MNQDIPDRTLPADVRALLKNLPEIPRECLAASLIAVQTDDSPSDDHTFRRGLVAGMINAATQRGELNADERGELLLYALGFRDLAEER